MAENREEVIVIDEDEVNNQNKNKKLTGIKRKSVNKNEIDINCPPLKSQKIRNNDNENGENNSNNNNEMNTENNESQTYLFDSEKNQGELKKGFLLVCNHDAMGITAFMGILIHYLNEKHGYVPEDENDVLFDVVNSGIKGLVLFLSKNLHTSSNDQTIVDKVINKKSLIKEFTPSVFVDNFFEKMQKPEEFLFNEECKHLYKIIPLDQICVASENVILDVARLLIEKEFPTENTTFAVICKIKNNEIINEKDLTIKVANIVDPKHKVDLTNPKTVILVEIIKSACGISIVSNYYHYKKYTCKFNIRDGQ
eukprot:TRINITY_DN350_c1_g1_i1.p1 TRINITY_DN350_c1_g1~~TRINITY_DN350_c1_g1_i1.p1  ORF type:complete len:310 (+),score=72.25 TRINITY_DN350_c1_g1_i1:48-977(+)